MIYHRTKLTADLADRIDVVRERLFIETGRSYTRADIANSVVQIGLDILAPKPPTTDVLGYAENETSRSVSGERASASTLVTDRAPNVLPAGAAARGKRRLGVARGVAV